MILPTEEKLELMFGQSRGAHNLRRWPNGVVPYTIDWVLGIPYQFLCLYMIISYFHTSIYSLFHNLNLASILKLCAIYGLTYSTTLHFQLGWAYPLTLSIHLWSSWWLFAVFWLPLCGSYCPSIVCHSSYLLVSSRQFPFQSSSEVYNVPNLCFFSRLRVV